MRPHIPAGLLVAPLLLALGATSPALSEEKGGTGEVWERADLRYASPDVSKVPDFQRHVIPLLGRLGCNGRACHGSFQGKGGFRLSLFGYDFEADHKALTIEVGDEGQPRINRGDPEASLLLTKPTNVAIHEGGQRYEKGQWEYHLLRRWVEAGAKFSKDQMATLKRLEVSPVEIIFEKQGDTAQLRVIAVWEDGHREDVTPLARFQTNNEQIATVSETGLVTAGDAGDTHIVVFYDNAVVPTPVLRPVSEFVGDRYPQVAARTRIDELVLVKLRKLGIIPSELCTDAEFLRRVKLDLTGTLPTPSEVEQFLADSSPNKRARKIDELLESPAYVAWWTTKLCDFTGNNDNELRNAAPVRGRASQDWFDWIYARVAKNAPYDEIVEGIVLGQSRNPGESYLEYCKHMSDISRGEGSFAERQSMPYYWARNNLRTKEDRAIGFAYSFLGVRIQCAQCHKHPFDHWTKEDFEQFTGFFSRISAQNRSVHPDSREDFEKLTSELGLEGKRNNELQRTLPALLRQGETIPFAEIYPIPPRRPGRNFRDRFPGRQGAAASAAKLLGGAELVNLNRYEDAREPLMDWLRREDNPYFAKALVNRVWATYFHVGIVEPPDDLNLANPPSNAPLLDFLAEGFIDHGFDMKWVHREILNSDTYQRSWRPHPTNEHDLRNFSRAVPRRLPAEVVYDALVQATASDSEIDRMQSDITGRAIAQSGVGARNGNNGPNFALNVFGRSTRESNCDCDRSSEPSLLQTVYLQNDRDMLTMIDRHDGWVSHVARELGVTASSAQNNRPPRVTERQIVALEQRIRRLRREGDANEAARLERRLTQLRRIAASSERVAESTQPIRAAQGDRNPHFDSSRIVEQAYLRTLSRYPSDAELATSREYLTFYENPVDGVRGLLWALLNTKEFIVNH